MEKSRRPALRYYGGKWRIALWILSYFPEHTCYVEPFGGAGSVLLRKNVSHLEVYNDLDGEVVNFFQVLRGQPEELIGMIELTPFSKAELKEAFELAGNELERARRFYICSWQGRGSPRAMWRTGWRFQKSNARGKRTIDDWNDTEHLRAVVERLKQVQIECDDWQPIIKRYDTPDTLFYCDPPYLASTRSTKWRTKAYQHEMSEADHRRLAEVLNGIKGMAIVSGYPSSLYDEIFAGWKRVVKYTQTDAHSERCECLWISSRAIERHKQRQFEF